MSVSSEFPESILESGFKSRPDGRINLPVFDRLLL